MATANATPLRVGSKATRPDSGQRHLERILEIERSMTPRQVTLQLMYYQDKLAETERRLSEYSWRDNPPQGSH